MHYFSQIGRVLIISSQITSFYSNFANLYRRENAPVHHCEIRSTKRSFMHVTQLLRHKSDKVQNAVFSFFAKIDFTAKTVWVIPIR